jgi:propionyl-CoA carboxylase alpha chain
MKRFNKVLIANRGEIAVRIARTLAEMGIPSVAVFSDADADAPHVRAADEAVHIGEGPSRESYLVVEKILDAAKRTGADAIHPGYGFLAENAAFAEACAAAGVVFIGPPVNAIQAMGSKIEAKILMEKAGVPVIPGFSAADMDDAAIAAGIEKVGFPALLKASAGGGGKGMRIVREGDPLGEAIAGARREAEGAFGDGTLLVERYFDSSRHIEVQIFADADGRAFHCFERECSIQRRYQKIIEEAPSAAVDEELRERLGAAAVSAAQAIGYRGAGTVEFLLDASGKFYFLEINTRLQVEHPVTEAVTGLDLVRMQVDTAQGLPLSIDPDDLTITGHAIEARLYAEDPAADFLPQTGTVSLWRPADLPGLRYDSGIEEGSVIGVHYDPMLAKIIAYGPTREDARRRLIAALRGLGVAGVQTNRDFLVAVLSHDAFADGRIDTHFIPNHFPAAARATSINEDVACDHSIAAALFAHERRASQRRASGPFRSGIPSGWRNNAWRPQDDSFVIGERRVDVLYRAETGGVFSVCAVMADLDSRLLASSESGRASELGRRAVVVTANLDGDASITLELDGLRRAYRVREHDSTVVVCGPDGTSELTALPRFDGGKAEAVAGGCVAPMTGLVRTVHVKVGQEVEAGQVLLVLEAMKMEHQLTAHTDGVVTEVRVEDGAMVDPDDVLVVVEAKE